MNNKVGLFTLGDCCIHIRNGVSVSQTSEPVGIPITRIETISNGEINPNKLGYAGITDERKYSGYFLEEGDILVSHINSETHLGKSGVYAGYPAPLIHGMNLLCLRPDRDKIEPKFLYYFTKSNFYKTQLPKITNKSVNQASFKVSDFKSKIKIPLPSLSVQKRAVNLLDEAYGLSKKRNEAVKLLDDYVKSVFLETFGDPIQNQKRWTIKPLIDFGQIITGNTPSRNNPDNYSEKYIEWVKTNNQQPRSKQRGMGVVR